MADIKEGNRAKCDLKAAWQGDTGLSLTRAKEYIRKLHSKQSNPNLWPDFLTGLPDKAAVLRRVNETLPRLGTQAVAYVRIANINPYLLKYGAEHHAELVQWAAAVLRTSADDYGRGYFVGAVKTHDFVVLGRTPNVEGIVRKANSLFLKRTRNMYSEQDLERGYIISFQKGRARVNIGLMRLIYVLADSSCSLGQGEFMGTLQELCAEAEHQGAPSTRLTPDALAMARPRA